MGVMMMHKSPDRADTSLTQIDKEGRKEMSYLTLHLTHFVYGYMASDIW